MSKSGYDRRYLGTIITAQNYKEILAKEGRRGINFHNKHLKAHLRGDTSFTYGYQRDSEGRILRDRFGYPIPIVYQVQQEFIDLRQPKDDI